MAWILDHLEDLDADFLAIYGIEDPWSMPAWRFFGLATRLFYYQGTMQYRLLEEEEQGQGQRQGTTRAQSQGVNHNTTAFKAAARNSKDDVVQNVPLAGLMAMLPGVGEYTTVSKQDQA